MEDTASFVRGQTIRVQSPDTQCINKIQFNSKSKTHFTLILVQCYTLDEYAFSHNLFCRFPSSALICHPVWAQKQLCRKGHPIAPEFDSNSDPWKNAEYWLPMQLLLEMANFQLCVFVNVELVLFLLQICNKSASSCERNVRPWHVLFYYFACVYMRTVLGFLPGCLFTALRVCLGSTEWTLKYHHTSKFQQQQSYNRALRQAEKVEGHATQG